MTGNQVYTLRKRLSLGRAAFGRRLGYKGNDATIRRAIARAEALHDRPIPSQIKDRIDATITNRPGPVVERLKRTHPGPSRSDR